MTINTNIKISPGNSKMGAIPSVSLPAIKTCRDCKCKEKCYAAKLERLRPTVRNAYQHNLEVLQSDPETFWREVEATVMLNRYFRFHVSGDIPSKDYLLRMIGIAERNRHCEILCFTKRYDFVNAVLSDGKHIPDNLHLILSGWVDLEMVNPFSLPEAHVRFKDGTTTARVDAKPCNGNCAECAMTDTGCWTLKRGEQVVFNEH